ncbi:hydroxyacylglutathione hydrolase [Serratia ficaria]|uniref:Hydroxyacylglutathione hydrolase n=1 Tax=Serratia ficaria TaxID=61651 RepID=A0A240B294_SERFI|nr:MULTISPECIES: hydroxyacylglutathione hydrolase [Serratia]MEE4483263.1 hydroxyacylglutathione hydrolase [Serratia ficaria]REF46238.1 hydroxyacylglutathione hydrolase [Serratia ficaria]CAI0877458.1 Hydroxyacylglutathione hydrolase [Serratia ficaria]CAI0954601.1 Hydroxyacylglutathione hydrolase [Serratia ficaria]CAI0990901.1 Hydroxyacylglutathione hydrolase [Serratia ficaria]
MNLISIPAFQDNYIWLLDDRRGHCVIVDPGEAQPALDALRRLQLTPDAILLTHHHQDHVGGVAQMVAQYPGLPVYGPQETADKGANHIVRDGETFEINGRRYATIAVPGHTLGHVAFYSAPYLFCGDTIFSAGCGRLFEGTAQQMHDAFQQLAQLPDNTLICCAHEYTLSNLKFARAILPQDREIETYQQHVEALRAKGQPSVPTTLQLERKINLFLRCHDTDLQNKLGFNSPPKSLHSVFSELRLRKDNF